MNILLVEDEQRVRKYLEGALRAEGHTLTACADVEETLAFLKLESEFEPELAILDRMLGDLDGLEVIVPLRQRYPACKVLILSAIGTADEKAQALDQGADDYLTKPFSLNELTARMRALSRRTSSRPANHSISVGDLSIDLKTQTARVDQVKLDLSKKEFQLLCTLSASPNRVFNKFQLLDRVWDQQVDVESNTVEVTIKNLRRKLETAQCQTKILSKRNVGYWIEA